MADNEVTGNDLVEEVTVTVQDAQLISYAVDSNLTVAGAAADAKAVGDRFAVDEAKTAEDILYASGGEDTIKDKIDDLADNTGSDIAVSGTDNTSIASKISTIEGKLYATQIPVSSSAGADTIAEALTSQAARTGDDILYTSGGSAIKTVVDGINTRLGTAESSLSTLNTTVSGMNAVKYTAQTLSAQEQAQARTNIGALSSADAVLVGSQTLTNDQKAQARSNIGAVSADETVSVSSQVLSAEQQEAVRTNIGLGAAATKDIYNGLDKDAEGFALDARQGKALKDTLDNTLTPLATNFGSLFRTEEFEFDYSNLASGSNETYTREDLGITAIDGYTPVTVSGIVTGYANVILTRWSFTSNTYCITVRNMGSSALTASGKLTVLYARTAAFVQNTQ